MAISGNEQLCRDNTNFEEQAKVCGELIRNEPNNPVWLYFRGMAYVGMGKFDLAIEDAKIALSIDRSPPETNFLIGISYSSVGKWKESIDHLNYVINTGFKNNSKYSDYSYELVTKYNNNYPKHMQVFLQVSYNVLANSYKHLNDIPSAFSVYSRYIKNEQSDRKWAFFKRAELYAETGKRSEAMQDLAKALAIDPNYKPALELKNKLSIQR